MGRMCGETTKEEKQNEPLRDEQRNRDPDRLSLLPHRHHGKKREKQCLAVDRGPRLQQ